MRTSITARAARRMGRIAAVGAVALVLVGATALPAEARPPMAVYRAIAACEDAGGIAHYFSFLGLQYWVACEYEEVEHGQG